MTTPMISRVGSSEIRKLASSDLLSIGDVALISTFCVRSSASSSSALANVGTSVVNFVFGLASPGGSTSALNSPEIVAPFDAISLTLPASTCCRNVGL